MYIYTYILYIYIYIGNCAIKISERCVHDMSIVQIPQGRDNADGRAGRRRSKLYSSVNYKEGERYMDTPCVYIRAPGGIQPLEWAGKQL